MAWTTDVVDARNYAIETIVNPDRCYEYWVSDDNGETWLMVALVGERSLAKIQAQPMVRGYMRKFTRAI